VYLTLYLRPVHTLARRGSPVVMWRRVSLVVGVVLPAVVQVGPLDSLADEVLVAHAVQHIVIGDFCSLLIVLGLTGPVLAPLLQIRVTRPIAAPPGP